MFSSTLRSRQPWPTILSSLSNLRLAESTRLITTDLKLPDGISVLLITYKDDHSGVIKRLDRAMQSEDGDIIIVIFLGNGVWEFQLLFATFPIIYVITQTSLTSNPGREIRLDRAFSEPVYLIPLSTPQELPGVLESLVKEFKATAAAQVVSEAKDRANWTPARMLPLMTTTNSHLSSHTTLVLHSLFPSLQALARGANEHSLEILEDTEARGVVDFLDVEFVFGG